MENNIYSLSLHEEIKIDDDISALRVPGGWVYKFSKNVWRSEIESYDLILQSSIFVPFNNEFMEKD